MRSDVAFAALAHLICVRSIGDCAANCANCDGVLRASLPMGIQASFADYANLAGQPAPNAHAAEGESNVES